MVRDTDAAWPAWAQDLDCLCHLTVKTLSTSLHHCAFIVFRETGKRSREANPSTSANLLIYIGSHFRTASCRPILYYIRTVSPKFDLLTLMSFQTVTLVFIQWMKVDGVYRAVMLQKVNKNNIKRHRSKSVTHLVWETGPNSNHYSSNLVLKHPLSAFTFTEWKTV